MGFEIRNTKINNFGNVTEIICPECNSSNIDIISGSRCWNCSYMFLGPFNYYLKRVVARFHYHNTQKGVLYEQ